METKKPAKLSPHIEPSKSNEEPPFVKKSIFSLAEELKDRCLGDRIYRSEQEFRNKGDIN
jgi:hypothetical protein